MPVSPDLIVPSGGDWVPSNMDYKAFREAGHSFAMRYAVPGIPGKMIAPSEVQYAHSHGIDIGLVYEVGGTSWRGGRHNGLADGATARDALAWLGAPHSVACYHAIDESVSDNELGIVQQWLTGVRDGMRPYRTGAYGQYSVIEAAYELDPSIYRWQTQAWSQGKVSRHADILQLGSTTLAGINIDLDIAYVPAFGQWYADPGKQPGTGKEETMPLGVVGPEESFSVALPAGTYTTLTLYCDIGLLGHQPQKIRVAMWSKTGGYSQITDHIITSADPGAIGFTAHDVAGVSFSRVAGDGEGHIGYCIE